MSEDLKAKRKMRRGTLIKIVVVVALLEFCVFQWRLLSFCILGVVLTAIALCPSSRRVWLSVGGAVVLAVSLFLPFDVAIGSYHYGMRMGTSPGGPHLVEFVVGMPMHTRLIENYGEYISGGCTWPAAFPPRWILVWN